MDKKVKNEGGGGGGLVVGKKFKPIYAALKSGLKEFDSKGPINRQFIVLPGPEDLLKPHLDLDGRLPLLPTRSTSDNVFAKVHRIPKPDNDTGSYVNLDKKRNYAVKGVMLGKVSYDYLIKRNLNDAPTSSKIVEPAADGESFKIKFGGSGGFLTFETPTAISFQLSQLDVENIQRPPAKVNTSETGGYNRAYMELNKEYLKKEDKDEDREDVEEGPPQEEVAAVAHLLPPPPPEAMDVDQDLTPTASSSRPRLQVARRSCPFPSKRLKTVTTAESENASDSGKEKVADASKIEISIPDIPKIKKRKPATVSGETVAPTVSVKDKAVDTLKTVNAVAKETEKVPDSRKTIATGVQVMGKVADNSKIVIPFPKIKPAPVPRKIVFLETAPPIVKVKKIAAKEVKTSPRKKSRKNIKEKSPVFGEEIPVFKEKKKPLESPMAVTFGVKEKAYDTNKPVTVALAAREKADDYEKASTSAAAKEKAIDYEKAVKLAAVKENADDYEKVVTPPSPIAKEKAEDSNNSVNSDAEEEDKASGSTKTAVSPTAEEKVEPEPDDGWMVMDVDLYDDDEDGFDLFADGSIDDLMPDEDVDLSNSVRFRKL